MKTTTASIKTVVDPVCGMTVEPKKSTILSTVQGQTYWFCAEGCRRAFEENPAKYLKSRCAKRKGWWGRYVDRLERATGGQAMKCH